jgi:replicative DNA helicase
MTTDDILRPEPAATMAEKALLSCMMQYPEQFITRGISEGLEEDSFSTPALRETFRFIVDDFHAHGSIDLTAFVQRRQTEGMLDRIGGPWQVTELYTYAASVTGWQQWLDQMKEAHAHRIARTAGRRLLEAENSTEAAADISAALDAIRKAAEGPRRSVAAKDAARDFLAQLEADHKAGKFPGAETGLIQLDLVSGGMRPGEFWVIAGRPSLGKSVAMIQIAAAFLTRGENVAIFSLEMMAREVIGRLVTVLGRVNFGAITQPRSASTADLARIQAAVATLARDLHLWIDATAGQSLETIRAEAQRLRAQNRSLALVVVDYLQLIRGGRTKNESREEEIARVSGGLKQLAKELRCPVLSASQLNEAGQTRESRAIEQDADALLFIAADGIKIGKLRNGRRNDLLPLFLNGEAQLFTANARP